ncbi:MAG: hypothetical protein IT376_02510 [Polyangiaceae bacterium]|nr:hypothetical protein [Polyangiaceae bacterium]
MTPGGWHICTSVPQEVTKCNGSSGDECCDSTECSDGDKCYEGPETPRCGGIIGWGGNVCASDLCTSDSSCSAEGDVCVPKGSWGFPIRFCLPASCRVDADCGLYEGGYCAVIHEPCCGNPAKLGCVYPTKNGCHESSDCSSGGASHCEPNGPNGYPECQPDGPICPL